MTSPVRTTAPPADDPVARDHGQEVPTPSTSIGRCLLAIALLLIPLAGIGAFLVIFQPFAGAAGSCGGG